MRGCDKALILDCCLKWNIETIQFYKQGKMFLPWHFCCRLRWPTLKRGWMFLGCHVSPCKWDRRCITQSHADFPLQCWKGMKASMWMRELLSRAEQLFHSIYLFFFFVDGREGEEAHEGWFVICERDHALHLYRDSHFCGLCRTPMNKYYTITIFLLCCVCHSSLLQQTIRDLEF